MKNSTKASVKMIFGIIFLAIFILGIAMSFSRPELPGGFEVAGVAIWLVIGIVLIRSSVKSRKITNS